MKKIMIDLDETICSPSYLKEVNKYLNTNYKYEDIKTYFVEDIIAEDKKQDFLDYFYQNVNVYDEAMILPDALGVIEKLSHFYEIYIVSAFVDKRRIKESSIMAKYKYEWILKNMPFIDPKKIVLTGSKDIIMCDIKIDDKVSNLKGYGETKLLMDQLHNQKYSFEELTNMNIKRVYDWQQVEAILLGSEVK
uniref:5' nucleotidase, NT5C type n=1 Tax=Candidatus Ventrenecus sp. TaxID=3085654 RepID=UPI004028E635